MVATGIGAEDGRQTHIVASPFIGISRPVHGTFQRSRWIHTCYPRVGSFKKHVVFDFGDGIFKKGGDGLVAERSYVR